MGRFKKVAVLMGGPSAERAISLRSGMAVAGGLREAGYDVAEVDIRERKLDLPGGIEAVFIALHGEFGEDGEVQELLERSGIPYTGSGPVASRASFDKRLSKEIFVRNGIPTPEYEVLREGERSGLSLPLVIKPPCQGSTIGVHLVKSEYGWDEACSDAFLYGTEIIAETYIAGRELTVGVVGQEALPVIEIIAPDSWYSYQAKYTKGACRYIVPAVIGDKVSDACRDLGLKAFNALGCRGFARVDFRLSNSGDLYVLELNNIPGFTETSLLPMAASEIGMKFSDLCDRIMGMAELGK